MYSDITYSLVHCVFASILILHFHLRVGPNVAVWWLANLLECCRSRLTVSGVYVIYPVVLDAFP